jgi:hypothetical protein
MTVKRLLSPSGNQLLDDDIYHRAGRRGLVWEFAMQVWQCLVEDIGTRVSARRPSGDGEDAAPIDGWDE